MKKLYLPLFFFCFSFFTPFAQGLWSPRASLPDSSRCAGINFTIGSYGYVGLGYGNGYYHDLWQFDPSNNKWTKRANFPGKATVGATAFVIGRKAYVVCGTSTSIIDTCFSECWQYDATTNLWTKKLDFPGRTRCWPISFTIGSKGYLGTGSDSATNMLNDFWQYDTTSDSWKQKNNFPGTARYAGIGFAQGNKGYLCFGGTAISALGDLWQYDSGTDAWTQKSSCPSDRLYVPTGFVINSKIYVGTGMDSVQNVFKTFWCYNILNDTWTKQSDFIGSARGASSAFAIGDTGYLGLGCNASLFYNNLYKFYPDTLTVLNYISPTESEISVYPNPFTLSCNITIPASITNPFFSLYDILGRKVDIEMRKIPHGYTLFSENLSPGIYILTIEGQNKFSNKKIIIN